MVKKQFFILVILLIMFFTISTVLISCISIYPDKEQGQEEEPPPGEQQQGEQPPGEAEKKVSDTNVPIVEGECGTFMENYTTAHKQGNYIFAGDSDGGTLAKGFVSFNITSILGSRIDSARLTIKCKNKSNNPSFFGEFFIFKANNWGARPLKDGDFSREDFVIQSYPADGGGSVSCDNPSLVDSIQQNIDSNSDRFQIIIAPNPVDQNDPGRNNNKSDGYVYFVDDITLEVRYAK